MAESVHSPVPHTCGNCKRQLGISVGVVPHHVTDDDGSGEGERESFCPTCFVFVVAPQHVHDDGRPRFAGHWHPKGVSHIAATHRAVRCMSAKCCAIGGKNGVESLSHGHLGCMQCGNPRPIDIKEAGLAALMTGAPKSERAAS